MTDEEPKKEEEKKDEKSQPTGAPGGVQLIAILFAIGGIMWLIYPFYYSYLLIFVPHDIPFFQWASQLVCCWIGSIVIAMLYFGISAGLIKGIKGAWLWAVIFAIIGLFNFPIETVISLIILIYLMKTKDYFKNDFVPPQAQ